MEFHVVLNECMPIIDRNGDSVGPKVLYAPESTAILLWALRQILYGKDKFLRKTQKPIEDRRKSPFHILVNYFYFHFFFLLVITSYILCSIFFYKTMKFTLVRPEVLVRFRTSNYGQTDSSYKFPSSTVPWNSYLWLSSLKVLKFKSIFRQLLHSN